MYCLYPIEKKGVFKMRKICVIFGMMILAGICGCHQNTVNTAGMRSGQETRFVTDDFLRDRLELKSIKTARTADGFLQAQLEVTNMRVGWFGQLWSSITGENPYKVRYKFVWFDANGIAVKTVLSDWQDATIIPGETFYLTSVAPSADCADFQVSFHEYND